MVIGYCEIDILRPQEEGKTDKQKEVESIIALRKKIKAIGRKLARARGNIKREI